MSTIAEKYKIDQWIIYKPSVRSIEKRAVILWTFDDKGTLWDYEIYIDGTGEIIKVIEPSPFAE